MKTLTFVARRRFAGRTALIGRVPGIEGAYVATGHSVWGVLNGPATGEALAELIVDGAALTTDLRPFDPGRLRPLDPLERSWVER